MLQRHHWFPRKLTCEKQTHSITTQIWVVLLVGWSKFPTCSTKIRSTKQIWVVTHPWYGNSAFVSQTSFWEKTIGVAKCRLFFQARICSTHVVVVHFYGPWYMYTVDWHQSCHIIIYFTCSSILWHWKVYALWANGKLKFALECTYVLQWAKSTKRASVINGCRRASSGVILLSGSITSVLFNKSVNWYLQNTHKFPTD